MKKNPVRKWILAVVQIAVMAMLQSYALLPVFEMSATRAPATKVCLGVHSICGCAPERIAAKNCCCYIEERGGESSCCDSGQHDEDNRDFLPGVYAAPCGEGTIFISPSATTDIDLPRAVLVEICNWKPIEYFPVSRDPLGRVPEPPDPPPKISC